MNHRIHKGRYYCLAFETQADGSTQLVEITKAEWLEIRKQNVGKTGDERRYFTEEFNPGYDENYWFICEATHEDYNAWKAASMKEDRSEEACVKNGYQVISLDAPAYRDDDGDDSLVSDIIADPKADTARDGEWLVKSERFRQSIAEWREWGMEMLSYHEVGMRRSCTTILAEEHHLCDEGVRYRKRLFRAASKALCKEYGIGDFD